MYKTVANKVAQKYFGYKKKLWTARKKNEPQQLTKITQPRIWCQL